MSDNRQFSGSISVRNGTRRIRLELSPAPLHGGEEGMYRVRANRRWIDCEDGGGPRFVDKNALARIAAEMAFASLSGLPDLPDLPYGSRISVRFWHDGLPRLEGGWTATTPIRGYDGNVYVGVSTYTKRFFFVPVTDIVRVHP